jgi:hypothetical protein
MAFVAASAVKSARAAKKPTKAVGGKVASRRSPAGDPNLERDRAAVQAIKDAREPEPEPASTPAPAPTSSGAGAGLPAMPAAVSSGSGFLLGVFAWALGLAYLRGGAPEVRRFMAAKFLNKTEG